MTWFAISILLIDGAALVAAGVVMHHRGLLIGGMICLLVAVGVFLMWQRQRRLVAELADARAELASEARSLRAIVRSDEHRE